MYRLGSLAAFFADWQIKEKIEKEMEEGEKKQIFGGRIQIEKYHNYGGIMNLLAESPRVMKGIHTGVYGAVAVYGAALLKTGGNPGNKTGVALLLAGGLNNLWDRYKRGYVVDYIRFRTPWKRLNDMIFNLSDFCVFIGAVLTVLFSGKKQV